MNNGYYYQVLINLSRESKQLNLLRPLKEALHKGDITDVDQFITSIGEEMMTRLPSDMKTATQFAFFAEQGMLFNFYRGDFDGLRQFTTLIPPHLEALAEYANDDFDGEAWAVFYDLIEIASRRLMGHTTIEEFEVFIDEIDFDQFPPAMLHKVSGAIGYVYLNEKNLDRVRKGRHWAQKAAMEGEASLGLSYYLDLARFFFKTGNQDSLQHIEKIIKRLDNTGDSTADLVSSRLYKAAVFDLQSLSLLNKFRLFDDTQVKVEYNLESLRDLEFQMKGEAKENNLPSFSLAHLQMEFARHYSRLAGQQSFSNQRSLLLAMVNDNTASAIRIAENTRDKAMGLIFSLSRYALLAVSDPNLNEKDFKELVWEIRKSDNHFLVASAMKSWADYLLATTRDSQKAYKALIDLIKMGTKKTEENGFVLTLAGLEAINQILLVQVEKPGLSWLIDATKVEKENPLEKYFETVRELFDYIESAIETIGRDQFDQFRSIYIDFEPVSHYNLKVYLQYQYFEIKLSRLNAIMSHDELGVKMTDQLLKELGNENNPLAFIKADWEEFRLVPNGVRNKVLNKCINITKGDLPAAADHIDFSYRNLRSYITFNEVNRLGFFEDERKTNNRKLEEGIRLMFLDLYKQGTIFEVVFDMPKFLVEFADGFASQDLEEALDIKGTTAKKYIKIMMDINLILHEKSVGRKHFYRLRRDNVMNRLGKNAKVLTQG
ncbi:MAG: hypothetical protein H6581_14455 [Bacteroidia bacterium]|nr:hypothetical protein [Bacteroidia bacterium]